MKNVLYACQLRSPLAVVQKPTIFSHEWANQWRYGKSKSFVQFGPCIGSFRIREIICVGFGSGQMWIDTLLFEPVSFCLHQVSSHCIDMLVVLWLCPHLGCCCCSLATLRADISRKHNPSNQTPLAKIPFDFITRQPSRIPATSPECIIFGIGYSPHDSDGGHQYLGNKTPGGMWSFL